MKKLKVFVRTYWRTILGSILIASTLFGLLGFSLGTIPPGYSEGEIEFIESSSSLESIAENPLYTPLKLPLFVLQSFTEPTPLYTRAISTFYAAAAAVMLFYLLRKWYSPRVAILGGFLFASSSWFLHIGRLTEPYVLFMSGSAVLLGLSYLYYIKTSSRIRLGLLLIAAILSLYVPGMIWVMLAITLLSPTRVLRIYKEMAIVRRLALLLLFTLLISPLIWACIQEPKLILATLALPSEFMPLEWLKRLFVLPIFLFAQGPYEPEYNLGRLPLLDVFSSIMVLAGIYAYSFKLELLRTKILIALFAVTVLLVVLNGPAFLPYIMPAVFILISGGLALLLQQWFTVFPKNPLVRGLGITIVVIAVGLTAFYHTQRYFVAWNGNPDTRNTFIYSLDQ
jgi:hypothetical protein